MRDGILPPHDLAAESAVLGILLLNHPTARFDLISHVVAAEDFYSHAHKTVFDICGKLANAGKPTDLPTVAGYLRTDDSLTQLGGIGYLTELINGPYAVESLEAYAHRVREQSTVRKTIAQAQLTAAEGYTLAKDPDSASEFLARTAQSFASLAQNATTGKAAVLAKDAVREVLKEVQEFAERPETVAGEATGFSELDEVIDGLQKENLVVLAARTGVGKTTFALNVASHVAKPKASGPQKHVLFFSLEMSKRELARKLIAISAQVNPRDLRNGVSTAFRKVLDAVGNKREFPRNLWIDDTPAQTTFAIRAGVQKKKIELAKTGDELALVVVDHLLLVRPGERRRRDESRAEEVGQMTRDLKNLAAETQTPVLLLAQMNRDAVKGTKGARPELHQLKSSGDIEQDANVVLFIWSPDEDKKNERDDKRVVITVAKNRNGRPDVDLPFVFHRSQSRFVYAPEDAGGDAYAQSSARPTYAQPHWTERSENDPIPF